MPPRRVTRRGGAANRGRTRGRGQNERANDEASHHCEHPGGEDERREEEVHQTGAQNPPNQFVTDLVAALVASNLLNQAPKGTEAKEAMREFRHMNPPTFDGESSDPLRENDWLVDIRKLFTALAINEDSLRVNLVACQLTGEANNCWESILAGRKDARRADLFYTVSSLYIY